MRDHLHPSIKKLQRKRTTLLFAIGAVLLLYIICGISVFYFPGLIGNYSALAGGSFFLTGSILIAILYCLILCLHINIKPLFREGSRLLTDTKPFPMMLSGIKGTALMSCFILRNPNRDDGKPLMAVVCKYSSSTPEPTAEDVPVQVYYKPDSENVLMVSGEKDQMRIGENLNIKDLRQEIKKTRLALWVSLPIFIMLAFFGAWHFGGKAYESNRNAKFERDIIAWPHTTGKILSSDITSEETVWHSKYYKAEIRYSYMPDQELLVGSLPWFNYSSSKSKNIALELVSKYPPGSKATIYYDPDDPSQAVMERGHEKEMMELRGRDMLLINLIFIEIAIVILIGRIRFAVCQDTKNMEELIKLISV